MAKCARTDAGHGQVVVVLDDHAHLPVAVAPDALEAHVPPHERLPVREAPHREQRAPALSELAASRTSTGDRRARGCRDAKRVADVLRIVAVAVGRSGHLPEDLLEQGICQPAQLELGRLTAKALHEILLGTLIREVQREPIEAERAAAADHRLFG